MNFFKRLEICFLLMICIGMLSAIFLSNNRASTLRKGAIEFIGFNSVGNDSFSIRTKVLIAPNTIIQFTDSEWNGHKMGKDESNIVWNSGKETIAIGTIIHFSRAEETAQVSIGKVDNAIKISKDSDAIFAYIGRARKPTYFLAAMANHPMAYGTLEHTGLVEGETAQTFGEKSRLGSNQSPNLVFVD